MFTNFADFIPALVIVSIPATAIVIGFAFQAFQNRKKSRALDAADSAAIAAAE